MNTIQIIYLKSQMKTKQNDAPAETSNVRHQK